MAVNLGRDLYLQIASVSSRNKNRRDHSDCGGKTLGTQQVI